MAKTKAKTAKTTKAKEAPESNEPKFSVDDLVEASGLVAASVRVALRDLSVEKNFGNKYGWDSKKDFDEVVAALKERSAKRKDKGGEAKAPAKSSKPARKGKGKGKK